VTRDQSLSAQFEHTIVVTKSGCEILTARDRPLVGSETVLPALAHQAHA
jgi:methionyl aminopeptidase